MNSSKNGERHSLCPCGSHQLFSICCQPYIEHQSFPETAEQLMRSRYSAFVLQNSQYLLESWHANTRPKQIDFDEDIKWLGLKILDTTEGQSGDTDGYVKFSARYKIAGKAFRLEEHSYFEYIHSRWFYCEAK